MARYNLLQLIRSLRQTSSFGSVSLLAENNVNVKAPRLPSRASELDSCNHLMTKYEPDLDINHPGFADQVYRARRKEITEIAFAYKFGDPIPHRNREQGVVGRVRPRQGAYDQARLLRLRGRVQEARRREDLRAGQYPAAARHRLHAASGSRYAHYPGLPCIAGVPHLPEHPVCPAHQLTLPYTRTRLHPRTAGPYTTAGRSELRSVLPDLASLGASDEEIEKLSTVYWFTVEFGLCKENNEFKAYGVGLLSTYGELLHAISDKLEPRSFEPASTAARPYQDQEYQPIHYVAESFANAKEKFRRRVSTMSRPFAVRFNPHTERGEVLDSTLVLQLNTVILHLTNAIAKLRQPFCKRALQ